MIGRESPQGQYMDKPLPRDYNQEPEREQGPKLNAEEWKKRMEALPRPRMTPKQLRTVKRVVIAAVVVIALIKLIGYVNGPKRTAASFFKAQIAECNYSKLYDMQDLPDGKFLTKEMFLKVYPRSEAQDITNYQVVSDGETRVSSGDSYYYGKEDGEKLNFIANYTVYYTVKGESALQRSSYQLIRQKGALGGLFPQWKVSVSNVVARRVRIYAPESVRITLDGEALGEEELTEDDSYYREGYSCYQVDLFAGIHTIDAEAEYMESQTFEAAFYGSDDSYEVPMLSLSGDTAASLQQTMTGLLNDIYSISYKEGDIADLYDIFTGDGADRLFEIYYQYIYESMHRSGMTLGSLEFSDFYSEIQDLYIADGRITVGMELYYNYDYDYLYTYSSWYSGDETRTEQRSSDSSMYASFVLEGDTWKVDDLSLYSIYN